MLTRQDRTITDCLAVLDLILPLKLRHIGFKDIGVEKRTLAALAERIRKAGAISYMEVVSTSPADTLNSARVAMGRGADRLAGRAWSAFKRFWGAARRSTTRSPDSPAAIRPSSAGGPTRSRRIAAASST